MTFGISRLASNFKSASAIDIWDPSTGNATLVSSNSFNSSIQESKAIGSAVVSMVLFKLLADNGIS